MRLTFVLALCIATPAVADSVVNETANLHITPSLGRGYTPAISAFHSVCFATMPTTKSTFDFDYTFEDVESEQNHLRESLRTYEVDDFLARNTKEKKVTSGKQTRYLHYMLAALVVDSYYSAIDEAHAAISKEALDLLHKGDLVSFFTSCGTHYIRSISRRSYFLTVFSYSSSESARDRSFELRIEQEVRKLNKGEKVKATDDFTEQSKSHDLKIVTRSIGLNAQRSSTLLPFDLASYQDSVKEAFKASQDDLTGRITAMETYPWLSNTEVLVLVGAIGGADKIDWSARKRILSDNAEFYIELSQHLTEFTSLLHRAEACREALDDEAFSDHKLRPEYAAATIISQRTGERASIKVLASVLTDANIDHLRAIGLAMRGGPDGKSGASACLAELESTELGGKFHNDIEACHWSRDPLPGAQVIEDFCMPQIERPARTTTPL